MHSARIGRLEGAKHHPVGRRRGRNGLVERPLHRQRVMVERERMAGNERRERPFVRDHCHGERPVTAVPPALADQLVEIVGESVVSRHEGELVRRADRGVPD